MRDETLSRTLERYESAPHLVFWEVTKACSLACRHCRASAQPVGLPGELTTAEGRALLDEIARFVPSPIVVLTGGDCLERGDVFELIDHARALGLRVGVAPSVTDRLNRATLARLHSLGVRALSISLDGAGPESHDGLRGVAGHFERTLVAIREAVEMGFRVQVNTTVTRDNVAELADVVARVRDLGVMIWEVFFLVGVGRGDAVAEVSAHDAEDVAHFLVDVAGLGLTVRTVEAPLFRRVQAERELLGDDDPRGAFSLGALYDALRARLDLVAPAPTRRSSTSLATGDGRGVIFVGHDGAVHASGFLPLDLGNVRRDRLGDVYAGDALLASMRSGELEGVCGACAYRRLCGGSRARAFSHTGRATASDPLCVKVAGGDAPEVEAANALAARAHAV